MVDPNNEFIINFSGSIHIYVGSTRKYLFSCLYLFYMYTYVYLRYTVHPDIIKLGIY